MLSTVEINQNWFFCCCGLMMSTCNCADIAMHDDVTYSLTAMKKYVNFDRCTYFLGLTASTLLDICGAGFYVTGRCMP
jgi:hypothetical protein